MKKFEPTAFWVTTAIASGITGLFIAFLVWFAYIGHEPFEPIHDEEPHASITKSVGDLTAENT